MSWEAWGDDGADDYDHLIEAGWWSAETAKAVCDCIRALAAEPVYEGGRKKNGISARFLMRLTDLQYNAGLIEKSALTDEAERALYPELHPPRFANTFCSQCGASFGPGEGGFSHCDQHNSPSPAPQERTPNHE